KVAIANFHPDADRLDRTVGDDRLVEFPSAARRFRIVRPLLVDERTGVAQHAVIKVVAVPGHFHGAGGPGTAAHGAAAVGVLGDFDAAFGFDLRDDFSLHP